MIVWLASYPRSGNSLIQSIFRDCMGLETAKYAQHLKMEEGITPRRGPVETWSAFSARAAADGGIHLVKTHHLPIDDHPAILILRDGRKCCWSYLEFKRRIRHTNEFTLLDLILGNDGHGHWTAMNRAWMGRPEGRLLVVRYEELVQASPETLARLAEFVGYSGTPAPWKNPFEERRARNPDFFREGTVAWSRPDEWTDAADWAFRLIHGPLMRELGYLSRDEALPGPPPALPPEDLRRIVEMAAAKADLAWRHGTALRDLQRRQAHAAALSASAPAAAPPAG